MFGRITIAPQTIHLLCDLVLADTPGRAVWHVWLHGYMSWSYAGVPDCYCESSDRGPSHSLWGRVGMASSRNNAPLGEHR